MQAIAFNQFGPANVLKTVSLPTPTPRAGEVLIQLTHTSVNPVDWKIREGYLQGLMPHSFPIIPGWDAVGTVTAVGGGVTKFRPGERVLAYARTDTVQAGTYAEYIALPEGHLAKAPEELSGADLATIPLVGLTAWQGLNEVLHLTKGQTILITAGAGGVGNFAIQFAKHLGATVITTASAKNNDYLRSLGADYVVDYNIDPVAAIRKIAPLGVDLVFDGAGGEGLSQAFELIKRGGRLVSIVETPDVKKSAQKGINSAFHFVYANGEQLTEIVNLVNTGKVRVPEYQEKAITEAAAAQDLNQTRKVRGKIILRIDFPMEH